MRKSMYKPKEENIIKLKKYLKKIKEINPILYKDINDESKVL